MDLTLLKVDNSSSYYLYIAPSAAPRDFTSHTVASTSISLTWKNIDCIQRNGVLTGFDIKYYRQVDGALATTIVGGSDTTSYTVGDLFPYSEYWFHIAAVNSEGLGPYNAFIGPIRTNEYGGFKFYFSDIILIRWLKYYAVPGPVSGLTVYAKFYSLELTWSPPQMLNGVLTSYEIMYTVNGSPSSPTASVMATSDPPTYIISSLKTQTTITNITITAHSQIGPGPSAQFSNVFTTLTEPRKCMHDCHGYKLTSWIC